VGATVSQVFISYSQKDKKRRDDIVALLRADGMNVWFDDDGVPTGEGLHAVILPQIEQSACVLVIHTKNTEKSKWVVEEIEHAIAHAVPVLIISFGNASLPSRFPIELQDLKRIVVPQNFTKTKKSDLLQYVGRAYRQKRAPVVTLLNLKGGVGKTALSANLFGCMHEVNRKSVLLIDLDPQHNLTQLLLNERRMVEALSAGATVMAAFRGFADAGAVEGSRPINVDKVLSRCRYPLKPYQSGEAAFDLIPGTFEVITYFLGDRHQHFQQTDQKWQNFRAFIGHCRTVYDIVVLDVNPGASLLTEVAIDVSTHVLSPVRPDRFSRYGLSLLDIMLDKLDVPSSELSMYVIFNGVASQDVDPIEDSIRQPDSKIGNRPRTVLKSRIPYSKRLEARIASPNVTDLTGDLAYHSRIGNNSIRQSLMAAASELVSEWNL
jgi:chromosome partitioning protein